MEGAIFHPVSYVEPGFRLLKPEPGLDGTILLYKCLITPPCPGKYCAASLNEARCMLF